MDYISKGGKSIRNNLFIKGLVIGIIFLLISMSINSSTGRMGEDSTIVNENCKQIQNLEICSLENDTEYWALLIAVGKYFGYPEENRPLMLRDVKNLHDTLLVSEHWNEDHIKSITAENCTMINIIKGLRWLDKMDDNDDFSLVYITTHGFPLGSDIFPRDEEDGCDEALVSYMGFLLPWAIIWDDLLNFLLSLLNSKGVCVIIDSCYSGGFNDYPFFKSRMKDYNMNANEFAFEFTKDLSEGGRVVLMSCSENEVSYLSVFSRWIIKALIGYADTNFDGFVSAEEAFDYVIENIDEPLMHPTIFDSFPGELQLTEVQFPPSIPEKPKGKLLGDINTSYNYSTVSTDPGGDNISYGWDWDGDYIVDEWTDFIESNTTVTCSNSWTLEGINNVRAIAKNEHNQLSRWSEDISVIMSSDHIPDQNQTENENDLHFYDCWMAQSFKPLNKKLSKVDIEICSYGPEGYPPQPLNFYIRGSLSGENLAECSKFIPYVGNWETAWYTFDFENINLDLTPLEIYYIVCNAPGIWNFHWRYSENNTYSTGEAYTSKDGVEWELISSFNDFCFVTWTLKT